MKKEVWKNIADMKYTYYNIIYIIKSKKRKRSFITKSESFVEYPRRKKTVKAEGVSTVEKEAE